MLAENRADVQVDPLLHKACSLDLKHYCFDVHRGEGRRKYHPHIHGTYGTLHPVTAVDKLQSMAIIIPLLKRFKVPAVLGYLCIGVVFGPQALGLLAENYPLLKYITLFLFLLSNFLLL